MQKPSSENKVILFVCRGNTGRSQIAKALFEKDKPAGWHAKSAGTLVTHPEHQTVQERPGTQILLNTAAEFGLNISGFLRSQISEKMTEEATRIIVMAEPETIPDYLKSNPKIETWEIVDPKGMDAVGTREVIKNIRGKVDSLIAEITEITE